MKKLKRFLIASIALLSVAFAGCNTEENMLVGTWYKYYQGSINQKLTFNSSGMYTYTYNIGQYYQGQSLQSSISGRWSYDENSRTLVTSRTETSYTRTFYVQSLTDSQLVLIESDGDSYTWTR